MSGTAEALIPVEETYLVLLREAIKKFGGQRAVADAADVDQATVSRSINGRATYTTLLKFSQVLKLPAPVVPIRDAKHERWCRAGAELAEQRPAVFALIYDAAMDAVRPKEPQPTHPQNKTESTDRLHAATVTPPAPRRTRRRTRPSG